MQLGRIHLVCRCAVQRRRDGAAEGGDNAVAIVDFMELIIKPVEKSTGFFYRLIQDIICSFLVILHF